jgi:hypothetical protein
MKPIVPSVLMLSVIMLNSVLLRVASKSTMLDAVVLNVNMLSVIMPNVNTSSVIIPNVMAPFFTVRVSYHSLAKCYQSNWGKKLFYSLWELGYKNVLRVYFLLQSLLPKSNIFRQG